MVSAIPTTPFFCPLPLASTTSLDRGHLSCQFRLIMHLPTFLLVSASLMALGLAQSACSGQQYNNIPGFPAYNSGCYPLGYYQTSDLGQTSPTDAQSRCQQQCTNMGSQCGSVVAQVNKAADSNLYPSGTCFFFAPGQTPTAPRSCADTAYLLEGYAKDSTLACFSSSTSAATQFCSSYLGIPIQTVTATITPPTTTVTATATSMPTLYVTSTVSATSTILVTTYTTSTSTVATLTATTTQSEVSTATLTTTITVTVTANAKRAVSTVASPACVTSGTPSTRLSAACSCLSINPSTTTTTQTAPQPTSTITTTTTIPITSTQTTTVTSATVTSTITQTVVVSTTATTVRTHVRTTVECTDSPPDSYGDYNRDDDYYSNNNNDQHVPTY